ncbi:MAG: hypothetical protein QXQ20_08180 [Candidatus Nezhaarchaeales archaeon]
MSHGRKLLAAREDLANKVSEIAKRRGWTLYELVNRILDEVVRLESMGKSLEDVVEGFELLREAREAGLILIPSRLWYELVERCYESLDRRWLEDLWYECGQWYGRYYESLEKLIEALKKFFWDLSSIDLSPSEGGVEVKLFLSSPSLARIELLSKFVEGAFESLGYELISKKGVRGALSMRFRGKGLKVE